jgi:glyoxylase-like metal-dependent hydrolase (beta-lactamase superfamily II)
MIQNILRTLAGLTGLLFLALGLMLLFAPGRQTAQFAILPEGNAGLSTMRGDLAGFFLGAAIFTLIGAIRGSNRWLAVPAVSLGVVIAGRILNLMFDGYSMEGARALVVELVLIAILLLTMASVRRGAVGFGAGFSIFLAAMVLAAMGAALLFQRQIGMRMVRSNVERTVANPLLARLDDGLHAGLCGSGSPLADPTRSGPCVFVIAGKHVYVVDTGDGAARRLTLMGLAPGLIDGILLTHFHSDHIGGLGEMMLQRWGTGSHHDPVPVFGPQGVESVVDGFNQAYALDKTYRIAHHGETVMPPSGAGGVARPFTIEKGSDAAQVLLVQDGLTITTFGVDHTPVFPAAGYRFDYCGRSVVISGDTAPSATLA